MRPPSFRRSGPSSMSWRTAPSRTIRMAWVGQLRAAWTRIATSARRPRPRRDGRRDALVLVEVERRREDAHAVAGADAELRIDRDVDAHRDPPGFACDHVAPQIVRMMRCRGYNPPGRGRGACRDTREGPASCSSSASSTQTPRTTRHRSARGSTARSAEDGPGERHRSTILDPATGRVIARIAEAGARGSDARSRRPSARRRPGGHCPPATGPRSSSSSPAASPTNADRLALLDCLDTGNPRHAPCAPIWTRASGR